MAHPCDSAVALALFTATDAPYLETLEPADRMAQLPQFRNALQYHARKSDCALVLAFARLGMLSPDEFGAYFKASRSHADESKAFPNLYMAMSYIESVSAANLFPTTDWGWAMVALASCITAEECRAVVVESTSASASPQLIADLANLIVSQPVTASDEFRFAAMLAITILDLLAPLTSPDDSGLDTTTVCWFRTTLVTVYRPGQPTRKGPWYSRVADAVLATIPATDRLALFARLLPLAPPLTYPNDLAPSSAGLPDWQMWQYVMRLVLPYDQPDEVPAIDPDTHLLWRYLRRGTASWLSSPGLRRGMPITTSEAQLARPGHVAATAMTSKTWPDMHAAWAAAIIEGVSPDSVVRAVETWSIEGTPEWVWKLRSRSDFTVDPIAADQWAAMVAG
ncbi:hypothetical protein BC828DRAFT_410081, partial [Blastocladiella britannica]